MLHMEQVRADYVKIREQHARKTGQKSVTLERARANAVKIDWTAYRPPQPRHACGKENNPPAETYSAPDPLHRRQGVAWVPGLAPLPPHSLQLAS